MGAMQNNTSKGKGRGGKRGSANNKKRLEAFGSSNGSAGADWGGCDPEKLQGVIVGITAVGGAVTIGLSRDMGAHSLTLLLDGDRQTLWFNGDADLDEELGKIINTLEALN